MSVIPIEYFSLNSQEFQVVLENLNNETRDLEQSNKEKSFEIETLKNKIHQYTNREGKFVGWLWFSELENFVDVKLLMKSL